MKSIFKKIRWLGKNFVLEGRFSPNAEDSLQKMGYQVLTKYPHCDTFFDVTKMSLLNFDLKCAQRGTSIDASKIPEISGCKKIFKISFLRASVSSYPVIFFNCLELIFLHSWISLRIVLIGETGTFL